MSHYFQGSDLVDIDSMSSGGFKSDDAIRSNISPLKRGKACAVCRAHKIRCDGVRPICGSCRRKPKADACDWDNSQSKSKVATLEETIETLKARIFELEHPELVTPSVTLHYPYRRDDEESFSHRSTSFDTQSSCPNPSFPSSDSYWDTTTPTTTTGISLMTSINGESITGGSMEFEYTRTAFPRQDASRYRLYRKDAVESSATSSLSAALMWQPRSS
ncbi:transcriptional regulator family: Fungal Specific TF [Agaricus bisporus var. burnettii]|uniref:Transcriptional regulator family: Fungal Specific TF n=1 Tax=Agaricus bisporus var. burnettii TaxID=192524 RepID=A0A8H7F124_AGABI|nr:transcriptional regulator family: Fungal Specific TF [Agaricus bisporus var. burnettii]